MKLSQAHKKQLLDELTDEFRARLAVELGETELRTETMFQYEQRFDVHIVAPKKGQIRIFHFGSTIAEKH